MLGYFFLIIFVVKLKFIKPVNCCHLFIMTKSRRISTILEHLDNIFLVIESSYVEGVQSIMKLVDNSNIFSIIVSFVLVRCGVLLSFFHGIAVWAVTYIVYYN